MKPFNKYFDHTLLKPDASADEISKVAREALEYDFCSVCVAGCRVPYVKRLLEGSNIKTACVTGFPLGSATVSAKAFETEEAIKNGADEIDTVINIGLVKEGRFDAIGDEIKIISDICHKSEVVLKTIIEDMSAHRGGNRQGLPHRRRRRNRLHKDVHRLQYRRRKAGRHKAHESFRAFRQDQGFRRHKDPG